ncbi:MAG TPA: ATP-dependent helicase C-terminal domain-containing protein, partial [Rhodanobacteraceae bacterium]|nr:ATP-dependent helicase C-terminal domain-containing protein [Rhodanobacteraceae bacterium]
SPLPGFNDDLRARVDALHRFRDRGIRTAGHADAAALAAIEQTARGWRKRLGLRHGASGTPDALTVGNLLLHAFPDRVARRDDNDPRRYRLANGRGGRLREDSTLYGEPWLVIAEARFDARDSLVLAAAPFDPERLQRDYPSRVTHERVLCTNANDVLEAFDETRFGAIVLERRAMPTRPEDALAALLATIRARGLVVLPWSEAASRLRARVGWLRQAMPEAGLPDVSDVALLGSLETWLAPALAGKRKLERLSAAELSNAFASVLEWSQRKLLDDVAPEALQVPSGMMRKLDYPVAAIGEETTTPVLAVKLQELFGLAETPRIARGRVPVTLHLLSPAGRPIQVTQDLRGFWERTYPEVKKELKGRYPKHPWPDDPWSAIPTHRTKRRS